MKYQKGYTLVELITVIAFFAVIAIICGLGYVAFHFLMKFW